MATDQNKGNLHEVLMARVAALHPASWNKTWENGAEASMNKGGAKYAKELAKLEQRIAAAEEKQTEAAALQAQADEAQAIVDRVDGKAASLQIRVDSCKKKIQELSGKNTCLLEKPKQVEKLHEQAKKLEAEFEKKLAKGDGEGGEKKKRKSLNPSPKASSSKPAPQAPVSRPVSRIIKGSTAMVYLEKLVELADPKNNPNPALEALRDAMMAAASSGVAEENFEYDVGPIDAIIAPPLATAEPKAEGSKSKAKDKLVLCNYKVGGCATEVKELYAENVCLNCYKTHLKERIRTLEDPPSDWDQEYERVYPDSKKTVPADPAKLAAMVKAHMGGINSVVSIGEDIRKRSKEEDEEEEDDEEDDSLVVPDNKISYASSSSESDYDDDDDDEENDSDEYEQEKNSDKKRGRAESSASSGGGGGGFGRIGHIAHRILMAKIRTPMDSRIKELCDLHAKAATAKEGPDQDKYLAAADVALEKLEELKHVFVIDFAYEKLRKPWPEVFLSYEEAEAKLAHLKSQYPGSNGEVQEKILQ